MVSGDRTERSMTSLIPQEDQREYQFERIHIYVFFYVCFMVIPTLNSFE